MLAALGSGGAMVDGPLSPWQGWLEQELATELVQLSPVGGGCIHSAWRLELADRRRLFAKTNRAEALPLLEAEAEGLRALRRWASPPLRVPEPLLLGQAGGQAVLVLPWLELGGRGGDWAVLGSALAALHCASASGAAPNQGFGFAADNFIGTSPQANGWLAGWAEFFVERRLGPQLAMAAAAGQPLHRAEALREKARERLDGHGCSPALVHGDLWSGNAALLAGGGAALFDPAAYWGDREVDLAMARLFGGFPEPFFTAYATTWPLPAGWQQRQDLYNLYHLINHANLFGAGYHRRAQALIDRLVGD